MHPARTFLAKLDPRPEARFNIETYTDLPKGTNKPKPDPLYSRHPNLTHADIEALLPKFHRINDQGAGVFVAVNEHNGQRCKASLARVRGVHADFDGVASAILDAIRERLQPTIEVQSSGPDNRHFYWLLAEGEEMDAGTAEALHRGLVELGADPAAIDVSRLLRLPGFRHMKNRHQEGAR